MDKIFFDIQWEEALTAAFAQAIDILHNSRTALTRPPSPKLTPPISFPHTHAHHGRGFCTRLFQRVDMYTGLVHLVVQHAHNCSILGNLAATFEPRGKWKRIPPTNTGAAQTSANPLQSIAMKSTG